MNYCRRCGTHLTEQSHGVFVCENHHTIYINAAPTAGMFFLTASNEVLLSVRGIEPYKGKLDSFGGFIDDMETAEEAIARELYEELGLSADQYQTPTFLCTEVGHYPYQGEERSILSIFYWSRLKPGITPVPADDVAAITTVPLDKINLQEMDNIDVRAAIQKLQKVVI